MSGIGLAGDLLKGTLTFTPDWAWCYPIDSGPGGSNPITAPPWPATDFPTGWTLSGEFDQTFDFTRRWYYFGIFGVNKFGVSEGGVLVTDMDTMRWVKAICLTTMYEGTGFGSPIGTPPVGHSQLRVTMCGEGTDIYLILGTGGSIDWFVRVDPISMKVIGELSMVGQGVSGGSLGSLVVHTTSNQTIVGVPGGLFSPCKFFNGIQMVPMGDGPPIRYDNNTENLSMLCGRQHAESDSCDIITLNSDWIGTSGNIDFWLTNIGPGYGMGHDFLGTVNVADILGVGTNTYIVGAIRDARNDCILMLISTYVSGLYPTYLVSYSYIGPLVRRWVTGPTGVQSGSTFFNDNNFASRCQGDMRGNLLALGGGGGFRLYDTGSGALVYGPASIPNEPLNLLFPGSFYRFWDSARLHLYTFALSVCPIRIEFNYSYTTVEAISPLCLHFLQCCDRGIMAHLYQITSATGDNDYFTDFDVPINYAGQWWKADSLRFEGLQRKVGVGLSVDEQDLKIWASPSDTVFGGAFLSGAEEGLLDGAVIVRKRLIWEFVSGNVALDVQNDPVCVFTLFTGYMGQVVKGGRSHVEFKVKSALVKLNVNMPRNYYQPGCLWTLYDSGCTLHKENYAVTSTVADGSSNLVIRPDGGVPNPTGQDGLPRYAQGRLLFTSGVNEGLQVLIDNNDGAGLGLAYMLNAAPSIGDGIKYYPGCSKSFNTCKVKFNNQSHFRGFDKVPPVMISV